MNKVAFLFIFVSLDLISCDALALDDSKRHPGLCMPRETVYMSCETNNARWISLCGDQQSLQYRFGRASRLELEYPQQAGEGPRSFFFAHYFRAHVDRTEVRFQSKGVEYVVFDHHEGRQHAAGVRVVTPAGKEVEFACRSKVVSRLGELKKVIPCDKDSALNGGQCPG